MTETVLFTFLFAWLFKGYKWSEIFKTFKHWSIYPIVLTCFAHIYFIYLMINGEYWFIQYSNYIKVTSLLFYLILIIKYGLLNISIFSSIKTEEKPLMIIITSPVVFGVLSIVLGTILNIIPMMFNDWKMPVFPTVSIDTGYSKIDMFNKMLQYNDWHVFGGFQTKLIFFTDRFDYFFGVMSMGDIITRIFVVLILYYSIKQLNKQK